MYCFLGPYTITNALPYEVYQMSDAEGNILRATGDHLKLYQTNKSDVCLSHQALLSVNLVQLTCTTQNTSVTFTPCEDKKSSEALATAVGLPHSLPSPIKSELCQQSTPTTQNSPPVKETVHIKMTKLVIL